MKCFALSFTSFVAFAVVAVISSSDAQQFEEKSIPDAAKELAPRIARELQGMELKDGSIEHGIVDFSV
ncbi:MAG: hypothetical protein ABI614_23015 [Planctomycetota bacterium]